MAWLALFMIAPCLLISRYAFFERGTWGGIEYTFNARQFRPRCRPALCAASSSNSARIAATATAIAILIAYPAAYAIARAPARAQPILLFFAVLPFWSTT